MATLRADSPHHCCSVCRSASRPSRTVSDRGNATVLSEATYRSLTSPPADARSLGEITVKGRETPLSAWRVEAPFWAWAATSVLLGLGFTFFSGATEAWLVDALARSGRA